MSSLFSFFVPVVKILGSLVVYVRKSVFRKIPEKNIG